LKSVIISEDAIDFLHQKRKPNSIIVIYRGIRNIREFTFIPKLKVLDRKEIDDKYFMMNDDSCVIPVWIEKGVLSYIENRPILITLKKGLLKSLRLETGYRYLQSDKLGTSHISNQQIALYL
jgi:hypothetical protein